MHNQVGRRREEYENSKATLRRDEPLRIDRAHIRMHTKYLA